jgi:MFS family permease
MSRKDPVLILCAAVVGVASVVASFATLMALAAFVGWQGRTTWLLPACIDALAVGAGRVWLSSAFDAEARRYARAASLAAIGASVAGNAVGHLVALDDAAWWKVALAILVGSVPPVALAAVGHLLTLTASRPTVPAPVPVAVPRPAEVPATVPAASPERPVSIPVESPAPAPGTGKAKGRRLWDNAPADAKPDGAELARYAGVDPSLGRRWRREWSKELVNA